MNGGRVCVSGCFADEETCVHAVEQLHEAGLDRPRVFSPFPSEKLPEVLALPVSRVRVWVLLGGLTGCATGFVLTIGLSAEYPHVTAGMPIVSIPPFVIIAFELTILFGALSGLIGFLFHGRFPRLERVPGYRPRFTNDRFGVVLECDPADRVKVESVLRAAGAEEVDSAP